jgi:hypothetical protein
MELTVESRTGWWGGNQSRRNADRPVFSILFSMPPKIK